MSKCARNKKKKWCIFGGRATGAWFTLHRRDEFEMTRLAGHQLQSKQKLKNQLDSHLDCLILRRFIGELRNTFYDTCPGSSRIPCTALFIDFGHASPHAEVLENEDLVVYNKPSAQCKPVTLSTPWLSHMVGGSLISARCLFNHEPD